MDIYGQRKGRGCPVRQMEGAGEVGYLQLRLVATSGKPDQTRNLSKPTWNNDTRVGDPFVTARHVLLGDEGSICSGRQALGLRCSDATVAVTSITAYRASSIELERKVQQ